MQVISLDYIVALYPFLLIFLTYVLVTLYDSNYRILVWAWKPFGWFFKHYQKQFNIKASLVETFATFILFSNVKILSISFDLLSATRVYNASGVESSKWYVYYDANIEYLSGGHLPFALLALFTGFLFVLVPFLLLLLYPCGCFQQCLNCLGLRLQTLHIFMDAFQGSYKLQPRDMRHFSVLYLILRFVLLLNVALSSNSYYAPMNAFVMAVSVMILALCQPHKNSLNNTLDLI